MTEEGTLVTLLEHEDMRMMLYTFSFVPSGEEMKLKKKNEVIPSAFCRSSGTLLCPECIIQGTSDILVPPHK